MENKSSDINITMIFDDVDFNGDQEIFGYIKMDPQMTYQRFIDIHMEEQVLRLMFDMNSVEESFNRYPAFTKSDCEQIFQDRPEQREAALSRLRKHELIQDLDGNTIIETSEEGGVELSLSFGEGVVIEGTRETLGVLKMDPAMTCEIFIKTKFDQFLKKVVRMDYLKEAFNKYPAFTREDCERELKNAKALSIALARLEQFKNRDQW